MDLLVEGVHKRFGSAVALAGVDLAIGDDTHLLLAGANGAGKTTLLRLLAGLTGPSEGRVTIGGQDPRRSTQQRARLGLLSHQTLLYDDLTAAENLRFFAGAARYQRDEAYRTRLPGDDLWNVAVKKPIGVAGCISPWNLPLYLFTWKIAPALAAGCTVVGKPSELTPATADLLARAAQKVDFPAGVLNIVQGAGSTAGASIVAHPGIPALSFTGGTATGASIATIAAPMFKKTLLELGGKNPTVVFADADLIAGFERRAALPDDDVACTHRLAAVALDAESFGL